MKTSEQITSELLQLESNELYIEELRRYSTTEEDLKKAREAKELFEKKEWLDAEEVQENYFQKKEVEKAITNFICHKPGDETDQMLYEILRRIGSDEYKQDN